MRNANRKFLLRIEMDTGAEPGGDKPIVIERRSPHESWIQARSVLTRNTVDSAERCEQNQTVASDPVRGLGSEGRENGPGAIRRRPRYTQGTSELVEIVVGR